MTDDAPKDRRLGRGLSALLGEDTGEFVTLDALRQSQTLPVEFLHPGRFQPRHDFDDEALDSLVTSVKARGILQPILVRRHPEISGAYEIIAGERRWRAAQIAQLHEVPVLIKELGDDSALEIALIENIQRENLTAMEEAEGYRRLMNEFAHTQEDLARAIGKSRSHIANTLRLLGLPEAVKALLNERKLTAGHARALLNAKDPETLAETVVARGLNVRQTEQAVQNAKRTPAKGRRAAEKDADTLSLERDLSNLLGLRVAIQFRNGGGELVIHYRTLDQLDEVLHRLSQGGASTPRSI